ncbi:electron transport complex subunit E [Brucepastera parasyntrophica]|uniref:electron transport complex subunit RsxE n=1 Tax=Brucepastera parasyntrophica TaxID=2880008 RepID=UPI00210B32EF|nr:electron transport complex subunit E [Brucepastera parasyntrophica]ULQ60779.1 electron transport complex subunit E [Brucepastera parasyntrophica]
MKKYGKIFANGLVTENPLLVLMIGLCSSLAITTSVANGLGMGLAMTFVLLMSEIIVSLFRKLIPDAIRIPVFIIIIATFTSIVDFLMQAFTPGLSKSMGVFIPLIVVNCIIMGRAEAFASKRPIDEVVFDALGMGIGYTWVLVAISLIREILGSGTIFKIPVIPQEYTIGFFNQAPGGFFVFGLMIAITFSIKKYAEKRKQIAAKEEEK